MRVMPLIDKVKETLAATRRRLRHIVRTSSSRGFVLILVVGALAVLAVLGYSFIEQSRSDLLGAEHSRDAGAADGIANFGFEMALRILADDTNAPSATVPSPRATVNVGGQGWTGRWGYNYNVDNLITANPPGPLNDMGAQPNLPAHTQPFNMAYSRNPANPAGYSTFLDSWQMMIWNEQPLNSLNPSSNDNGALVFNYRFDPQIPSAANPYSQSTFAIMRKPSDPRDLLDTWPLQPLARVKTYLAHMGNTFGTVQVSITARDGGINVNGMYDPGTCYERSGYHDSLPPGTLIPDTLARDRRTLEYVLGRRPEWSYRHAEFRSYGTQGARPAPCTVPNASTTVPDYKYDACQFVANQPAGSVFLDNGVYNFSAVFEPSGRSTVQYIPASVGPPPIAAKGTQAPQSIAFPAFACAGRNEFVNGPEPMIFYNAGCLSPNRYNFEACRYPLWVATQGPSMLLDYGVSASGIRLAPGPNGFQWYPTGRFLATSLAPVGTGMSDGTPDLLFHGFGFDRLVPKRGGIGASVTDLYTYSDFDAAGAPSVYYGAGMYGNPQAHSFQGHFINAVAMGRFWTDLQTAWYFGGSPGYTNRLGRGADDGSLSQWAHLGSSYDSCGVGTHWMAPTSHVSMPGFDFFSPTHGTGQLTDWEIQAGMVQHPRNMPPAKPAATYTFPITPFEDDFGMDSPQFKYSNQRNMIRAFGMQENWGPPGSNNKDSRYYDAPNINVAPYEVVYGLLTPEKFPSMLNRTVVAPHLHWKARLLDAAYKNMDKYERYTLLDYTKPTKPATPPLPPWIVDPAGPNNYGIGIHAAAPYYPKNQFGGKATTDDHPPLTLTSWPLALPGPPPIPSPPVEDPYGYSDTAGNFVKEYDIKDPKTYIGPAPWNYSIHKHYEPGLPGSGLSYDPFWKIGTGSANIMVLGKMDYRTPEPFIYEGLDSNPANPIRCGSGEPQDDVFVNVHYDLSLSPNSTKINNLLNNSKMVCRPYSHTDNADWFMQRQTGIDKIYNDPGKTNGFYIPARNIPPAGNLKIGRALPKSDPSYNGDAQGTLPGYPGANVAPSLKPPSIFLRSGPTLKRHPSYGLPNPDYLLLYPQAGSSAHPSINWCDQFRRYFPVWGPPTAAVDVSNVKPPITLPNQASFPMAPPTYAKMFDAMDIQASGPPVPAPTIPPTMYVQPLLPTPKGRGASSTTLFVPGISKDDAWRITRVGRKYQEIITDAIMDYQVNPWWPNPVAQFTEAAVPLDLNAIPADTRVAANVTPKLNTLNDGVGNTNNRAWMSYDQHKGDPSIGYQVPDYYAYFNRFWCRAAHTYTRDSMDAPMGLDYRHGAPYDAINGNWTEGRGIYPQTKQYFGQYYNSVKSALNPWYQDRIVDFPENTLEDQSGSEWRYLTMSAEPMLENATNTTLAHTPSFKPMGAQSSAAPARNHPFKNWADFVAMLGHLVYRSPMAVECPARNIWTWTPQPPIGIGGSLSGRLARVTAGIRDSLVGVDAYAVCHGRYADPKNQPTFFDGSCISSGPGAPAIPDALQGYYAYGPGDSISTGAGGRKASEAIIAIDGFWPISGNYGAFTNPFGGAAKIPEDLLYPPVPVAWPSTSAEWQRRIDEWRGRDAAGLRIEHHYISEAAANDILVSLSNGQIGPIDFDGDGHITMTRKKDIPKREDVFDAITGKVPSDYWPNFPYNPYTTASPPSIPSNVEFLDGLTSAAVNTPLYGVVVKPSTMWKSCMKGEIIQNCVTLPIKFRSNTFRVTVVVELTDEKYRSTGNVHRYSRTYSRIPGVPSGKNVQGPYTGEFILHSNRACDAVDPEMSWLGTDPAYNE